MAHLWGGTKDIFEEQYHGGGCLVKERSCLALGRVPKAFTVVFGKMVVQVMRLINTCNVWKTSQKWTSVSL